MFRNTSYGSGLAQSHALRARTFCRLLGSRHIHGTSVDPPLRGLEQILPIGDVDDVTDQVNWHDAGFRMEAVAISIERGVVLQ